VFSKSEKKLKKYFPTFLEWHPYKEVLPVRRENKDVKNYFYLNTTSCNSIINSQFFPPVGRTRIVKLTKQNLIMSTMKISVHTSMQLKDEGTV
jgi:hypothetical protein